MTEIILSSEQSAILALAEGPVVIRQPDGTVVGLISAGAGRSDSLKHAFSSAEIAAAEASSEAAGPWFTTEEVLAHLRSLEQPQR